MNSVNSQNTGALDADESPAATGLTCHLCGQEHAVVSLARGRRALCVRCGSLLAKRSRFGTDAALAFTITGILLALPALLLPLMTVGKFGSTRADMVGTGVSALWDHRMRLLAIWVLLCGALAPLLLLGTLAGLLLPPRFGWPAGGQRVLSRLASAMEYWAMPEVQVLAVLVALVKLGSQIEVHIERGFWCYAAMSYMTLLAWRSYEFERPRRRVEVAS